MYGIIGVGGEDRVLLSAVFFNLIVGIPVFKIGGYNVSFLSSRCHYNHGHRSRKVARRYRILTHAFGKCIMSFASPAYLDIDHGEREREREKNR